MSIVTSVAHDVTVGVKDAGKAVAKAIDFLPHAVAVLSDALKAEPELRASVVALITAGSRVIAEGSIAAAAKGTNVAADVSTVSDAEVFASYFAHVFLPEVSALYRQVRADIG